MKKNTLNIAIVTISLALASCSTTTVDQVELQEEPIVFSKNIKAIAEANCSMTCHNPQSLDAGLNLSTDELFIEAAQQRSILIERIENGTMPPSGRLSDENVALFSQWKEDGFLE